MKRTFWVEENKWWNEFFLKVLACDAVDENWADACCHLEKLINVTIRSSLANGEVEDLVQDMLLRFQHVELISRLSEADAPAHYIASMIRNCDRNNRRRRKAFGKVLRQYLEQRTQQTRTQPDLIAEWGELCERAQYLVDNELPIEDKELLWAFYRHGQSVKEIAIEIGISTVAVLQRLTRARKRLKTLFNS